MSPKTPTLAKVIMTGVDARLADVHTTLPGRVEKYDAAKQTVDVVPLIMRYQEGAGGEAIEEAYPKISGVPLAFPRVGKFVITIPVAVGDIVKLEFCEASIENYQNSGGRKPVSPELFQRFDLTDAIATPGWYPKSQALTTTDPDAIVIGQDGLTAQFVALANLVLGELQDVKADFDAFKSANEGHTHGYINFPGGVSTPALTTVPSSSPLGVPPTVWPTPHTPESVAAEKVKAT